MANLSANSHSVITADEFQTIKMSEVSDIIYRRIESKFRAALGNKAAKLLNKYADRPLRDVAVCQWVDVMDCFTIQ